MDPVRNGIVKAPAQSDWTSHRAYLRLDRAPRWLDVAFGLHLCGFDDREADRQRFDEFVRSCDRRHWQRDWADIYSVSTASEVPVPPAATTPPMRPSCEQIVTQVARVCDISLTTVTRRTRRPTDFASRARRIASRLAVRRYGYSRSEIARALGVSPQAITRMTAEERDDPLLAIALAQLTREP
jgi:hypothetical protein